LPGAYVCSNELCVSQKVGNIWFAVQVSASQETFCFK